MESEKIFERFAKQTPDGLAYYPRGIWGAGFIVDEATRHRIERYFDWRAMLTIGLFVLLLTGWIPGSPAVRVLTFLVVWMACNQAILAIILRRARQTRFRLTMNDMVARKAAESSRGGLLLLILFLLPGAWALAYLGLFRAPTHWTAQIATIVLLVVIGCNLVFLLRAIRARKTLHGL